jgi:hypothetical protein
MMQTAIDEYWTRSQEIGRLLLPPRDHERDISFIWHQSREKYGRGHGEIGLGALKDNGERVYVHAKAVFYSHKIILTVGLTPPTENAIGKEVGQVMDARTEGQTRHEVANCQAWYYEKEKVLMLWEVDLRTNYRESEDPTQDFLLSSIWLAFELALLRELQDVETIITPGHESDYDDELFRAFLRQLGYAPHVENTFRKILPQ